MCHLPNENKADSAKANRKLITAKPVINRMAIPGVSTGLGMIGICESSSAN
jgi:hypothetical protein